MFLLKLFMNYSVLLELSSILLLLKNVRDVIVLPPSGSPLLHQCFSIVRMLFEKKKWTKKGKKCVI